MTMSKTSCFAIAMAFLFALSPLAHAEESSTTTIAQLKQEGSDAFMRKDWPTALEKFEQAYALSKDPTFLYNQARTLESMQELPRALDAIEAFERQASPELRAKVTELSELITSIRNRVVTLVLPTPVVGAEVRVNDKLVVEKTSLPETRIRITRVPTLKLSVVAESYIPCSKVLTDLKPNETRNVACELTSRATRGLLSVTSTPGSSIRIDGTPRGMVPFEDSLSLGPHKIEISKEGFETYQSSVVITADAHKTVKFDLQKSQGITSKWWFWTAIGVVAAGATVVTVYAFTTEKDPKPGSISPGVIRTGFSY
jgi:PEGA domain